MKFHTQHSASTVSVYGAIFYKMATSNAVDIMTSLSPVGILQPPTGASLPKIALRLFSLDHRVVSVYTVCNAIYGNTLFTVGHTSYTSQFLAVLSWLLGGSRETVQALGLRKCGNEY